jgi:Phosphopantothenoylcysteine synthetase/decarboxylase
MKLNSSVASSSHKKNKIKELLRKLSFDRKGLKQRLDHLTEDSAREEDNIQMEEMDQIFDSVRNNEDLCKLLESFTTRHQSHHRPIAVVSSGGTATDLEVRAVRFLDNFSTGLRGAISVEEFLKRGYAVIHLWREGSSAPYSRVLSELLGVKQTNHSLSFDALGELFVGQNYIDENSRNVFEDMKANTNDPWFTSTRSGAKAIPQQTVEEQEVKVEVMNRMNLTKKILNSTILETKLRERAHVVKEGMLLTVPYRTVEEYLSKLKLCAEAIRDCQSLGLLYLTAAVSDFYIPHSEKAEHKIQSRDYETKSAKDGDNDDDDDGDNVSTQKSIYFDSVSNMLHLKLSPVPKLLGVIRSDFAPNAFCVSFKLETDMNILFQKARLAIEKYGVHMVIGNELETRYEKVWVLQKYGMHQSNAIDDATSNVDIEEICRSDVSSSRNDELEDAIISHVVEKHFEYIANHYTNEEKDHEEANVLPRTALMAGAEAAARHNAYLREKKQRLQNEMYWKRVRDVSLSIAGHALGMYLTYAASSALQRRFR